MIGLGVVALEYSNRSTLSIATTSIMSETTLTTGFVLASAHARRDARRSNR